MLAASTPLHIAILKPCCIGDVIFATALLEAVRRNNATATIDWLVSSWHAEAIDGHPALHKTIVIGDGANPAKGIGGALKVAAQIRAGKYDLLLVPDRSPWLSLTALLSGTPRRVGLDSGGRGFGYTLRASVNPNTIRREADIYLDLARVLGWSTADCWVNRPPSPTDQAVVRDLLRTASPEWLTRPVVIVHPGGGINPGMALISKRWPPNRLAILTKRVVDYIGGGMVVLGAASDADSVRALLADLSPEVPILDLSERLSLPQISALASLPNVRLYVGNDTGSAHMAAAAGARTLVIFGPSDPRRYAPFAPPDRAGYAWRSVAVPVSGVAGGGMTSFDWARDGVTVEEAWLEAHRLLDQPKILS